MFKLGALVRVIALFLLVPTALMVALGPADRLMSLMLIEPPDQLIYETGYAGELNLAGGRLRRFQDFLEGYFYESQLALFGRGVLTYRGHHFHSRVNFKKEGVYLILLARKSLFSQTVYFFQYTVQVVPPGTYIFDVPVETEERHDWADAAEDYCENVTAVMIAPPVNIVYPVGYEGEIDPSGIVVRAAKSWFSRRYEIAALDYTLESDVDFNVPGSYIVRVDYTDPNGKGYWFIFTVAVAEKAG